MEPVSPLSRIPFRRPTISTQSPAYKYIAKHAAQILSGRLLSVDPSIGSHSSMPGYSEWIAAEIQDSGTFGIPELATTHTRLYEIARTLRDDFKGEFDVLVIEKISVGRFNGRYMNASAHIPLHRASGAVMGAIKAALCIEIAPITWHQFVDTERYVKSDETDAIVMAYAVLEMAKYAIAHPPRPKAKKKRKKK